MRWILTLCLLVVALPACQSANRAALLDESVRSYATALRRQDNQLVIQYVRPELHAEFFENLGLLGRYNFSDIKVSFVSPTEDLEQAVVTLSIEYFSPTGMELYEVQRYLNWQYDDEASRWFLSENHPLGQTRAQTIGDFDRSKP